MVLEKWLIWLTSHEQKFSWIWDLCRNTANNITFHYRTNSVKINDQIFQWIKKTLFLTHFWSIFPISGAKNSFPENPAMSSTTSYGFLAPCRNLEKNNDIIPRKRPDRRKEGRTEGRTDPISYDSSGYCLGSKKLNRQISELWYFIFTFWKKSHTGRACTLKLSIYFRKNSDHRFLKEP